MRILLLVKHFDGGGARSQVREPAGVLARRAMRFGIGVGRVVLEGSAGLAAMNFGPRPAGRGAGAGRAYARGSAALAGGTG